MARKRVEYVDLLNIPMQPALEHGLPLGMIGARLSYDDETGASSWLARVAPQWYRAESGAFQAALELIVFAGDLIVGDERLGRGAYCHWPAGTWHGPLRSEQGCEVLLMFDGEPRFAAEPGDGTQQRRQARFDWLDIPGMAWEPPPGYEGRSAGEAGPDIAIKSLRQDPETDAYTLLVRQAPGWSEARIEAHEAWEELLLVEGDYLMGTNGLVTPGAYIFRPERIPHGPQATRGGSVWLARGDTTIDFQFTEAGWSQPMIDRYLAADLDETRINRTPWGNW